MELQSQVQALRYLEKEDEQAVKGIEDKRLMRRDLVGVWRKKNESRIFI